MGITLMPSLLEFLKTGQLGDLRGGLTEEQVRQILGDPDSIANSKTKWIWKYESLQLIFYWSLPEGVRRLITIGLYPRDGRLELPPPLTLEGWSPDSGTTAEDFRRFLENAAPELLDTGSRVTIGQIELTSSVRVSFDDCRLYCISYTVSREPDTEQVNISVPRAEMHAIRQEATALGVSVSKLCSQWIAERAANLQLT